MSYKPDSYCKCPHCNKTASKGVLCVWCGELMNYPHLEREKKYEHHKL